ncbi:hypothetical protein SXCC_03445 [Gluconacetobacter sp. SXCC-1]|nr:hypothetical protein SXCC_03445 [Gluconacetobacter sp. SXCC-1]
METAKMPGPHNADAQLPPRRTRACRLRHAPFLSCRVPSIPISSQGWRRTPPPRSHPA